MWNQRTVQGFSPSGPEIPTSIRDDTLRFKVMQILVTVSMVLMCSFTAAIYYELESRETESAGQEITTTWESQGKIRTLKTERVADEEILLWLHRHDKSVGLDESTHPPDR